MYNKKCHVFFTPVDVTPGIRFQNIHFFFYWISKSSTNFKFLDFITVIISGEKDIHKRTSIFICGVND